MYLITLGGDSEGMLSFMRRFRGCDEVSHRSSRRVVAGASGVDECESVGGWSYIQQCERCRRQEEEGGAGAQGDIARKQRAAFGSLSNS